MADSNPIKLCECGCGQAAPIAKRNNAFSGHIAGQPVRFIKNHHFRRHSHSCPPSRTYRTWCSIFVRCQNPKNISYKYYGARGITVCERWQSFENFLADMGERPEGKTLDRYPDNKGNYEPGNCRWATSTQQNNNSRKAHLLSAFGETKSIRQWAKDRRCAVTYSTLRARVRRNWFAETALTEFNTPITVVLAFGETKTISQWSKDKRCVVSRHALYKRLANNKWSAEEAITMPKNSR